MNLSPKNIEKVIHILKNGGIGIMPTDTIYGLVGSALRPKTLERIYKVRRRKPTKPAIILVGNFDDLKLFGITPALKVKKLLKKYWPGKVSIILPCPSKKFSYLHRGAKSLAFRLPKKKSLRNLLHKTGPLVAPSANYEGLPPARNIKEASSYFGGSVDFYLNGGKIISKPSVLIAVKNGKEIILRGKLAK